MDFWRTYPARILSSEVVPVFCDHYDTFFSDLRECVCRTGHIPPYPALPAPLTCPACRCLPPSPPRQCRKETERARQRGQVQFMTPVPMKLVYVRTLLLSRFTPTIG